MRKILVALTIVLCLAALIPLQGQGKREFASYQEMRKYLGELFEQKKYEEAAALLESVLDRFPDNVLANTFNLAAARLYQGDAERATQALEEGHHRGVFYGIWDFGAVIWDQVRNTPRFLALLKANQALIDDAQKKATVKIEAAMPAGYDPSKKYPLFIALHGGGESLAEFKPSWTSPRLRGEFITAYVQSTQVASMKGFHWQDAAVTKRDLAFAYKKILEQYPVDAGRTVIGGFSSGGFGSLVAAFGDLYPVRGFVILCPEPLETITDEDILAAKARGLQGTLLTTEADNRVEKQRILMGRMEKLGLPVVFHLTPGIGHWYPEDFETLLDGALGRIIESALQPRR